MQRVLVTVVIVLFAYSVELAAQPPAIPNTTAGFWRQWNGNGHYYGFLNETLTWGEAYSKCESYNTYMLTLTAQPEQNFIRDFIPRSYTVLLGAMRDASHNWRWVGSSPESGMVFWTGGSKGNPVNGAFSKWGNEEPNNSEGIEDIAELYENHWNDDHRSGKLYYVMEWSDEPYLVVRVNGSTKNLDYTPMVLSQTTLPITLSNLGGSNFTGNATVQVKLNVSLPTSPDYTLHFTPEFSGDQRIWRFPLTHLPKDGEETIGEVNATFYALTPISFTAEVSYMIISNVAVRKGPVVLLPVTVRPQGIDLEFTITHSPNLSPVKGELLTISLRLDNKGNIPATNVQVKMAVSDGLQLNETSDFYDSDVGGYYLESLLNGASVQLTATLQVTATKGMDCFFWVESVGETDVDSLPVVQVPNTTAELQQDNVVFLRLNGGTANLCGTRPSSNLSNSLVCDEEIRRWRIGNDVVIDEGETLELGEDSQVVIEGNLTLSENSGLQFTLGVGSAPHLNVTGCVSIVNGTDGAIVVDVSLIDLQKEKQVKIESLIQFGCDGAAEQFTRVEIQTNQELEDCEHVYGTPQKSADSRTLGVTVSYSDECSSDDDELPIWAIIVGVVGVILIVLIVVGIVAAGTIAWIWYRNRGTEATIVGDDL